MTPTLEALLDAAAANGEVRDDVTTRALLSAVAKLCMPVPGGVRSRASGRDQRASRAAHH